MNKVIIIPIFLCFLQMQAQPLEMNTKKPDFKAIEKEISDKNSQYFYETLFKKYDSGDTGLTTTDYWYLYYGYSFEPKYMPYQTIEEMDEFRKITQKKELEEKDFKRIISISEKEMKKLPFEMDLLWYEYVSWNGLGDSAKAKVAFHQFMGIVDAILASGNGMDCETGFSVLYVSHEYVLLNILGFEFGGKQSLTDGLCDKLEVSGNEYGIKALFFDVNRIFAVNLDNINK